MTEPLRCIAIIGAGFSGTVTAINLLRQPHSRPLHILLIDRAQAGRGVAYAAGSHPHLLNVPAGRMSALCTEPLDFLHFVQGTVPDATAEDFLPRSLYGDYLQASLANAEQNASQHVRLERVTGTVCSLEIVRPSHTYALVFADGREMMATEVVLALGNPPPAELPNALNLRGSPRLVENPWAVSRLETANQKILLVGTGLTMADVAVSLTNSAEAPAQLYALSRHGLVPPAQTAFQLAHPTFDPAPLIQAASVSMRQLVRQVRRICSETQERGGDWREAVTFVRTLIPRLWTKAPIQERKRFLRHGRAYWDIHRHRLAPLTRAKIDQLQQSKQLTVHAGRIVKLEENGESIRVTWQPRGERQCATLQVDTVINCTGPDYRCRNSVDPLISNLLDTGLIQVDTLGLGLKVSAAGGVLNFTGRPTRGLHYVGPMLRAEYWEATAVQELREHAERLALSLLAPPLNDGAAHPSVSATATTL